MPGSTVTHLFLAKRWPNMGLREKHARAREPGFVLRGLQVLLAAAKDRKPCSVAKQKSGPLVCTLHQMLEALQPSPPEPSFPVEALAEELLLDNLLISTNSDAELIHPVGEPLSSVRVC